MNYSAAGEIIFRLAQPGRNCALVARADRVGVLVDGEEYFRALHHALSHARRSILMLGWEFDSRTRLLRPDGEEIGALLDRLVRKRPSLEAHVLIWDSALIYAFNREFAGLIKMDWLTDRRLHFRLDDSHPLGASHHQKIVVVDDALAFVGGLDVSSQRWDSRDHRPTDFRRTDPAAPAYPPFHDVMAVLTGAAAGALASICRDRWLCASGQRLNPSPIGDAAALWSPEVPVRFTDTEVALALTRPAWDGLTPIRQVETLYVDMIARARRFIYLENQYFASRRIGQALEARLEQNDCPEIVIVNPGEPVSLMERSTMGVARARMYRRLRQVDRGGRLKIYYPSVGGVDVKVHAKLMIVDDRWLRIGSSNLNNRSMGLDTECDLLIEAPGIQPVRHDLMAEHLGASAGEVAAAELAAGGSLHRAIEALAGRDHTLMALSEREPLGIVQLIADSPMPDPEEPVETLVLVEEALPKPARRPLQIRLWGLAGLLLVLAVAAISWRWAPFWLWSVGAPWVEWLVAQRNLPETAMLATALFLAGGILRVPMVVMALAAAAALGPWLGAFQALVGALGSAMLLYGLGRAMGRARVRRLAGWKINRVHRVLTRHGIMAMVVLRLMPVAAFSVINLVAGASRVVFSDFVLGSALGMAPGIFAISVVGDRLVAVLRNPSAENIALLAAATLLVILLAFAVVQRLGRARVPRTR